MRNPTPSMSWQTVLLMFLVALWAITQYGLAVHAIMDLRRRPSVRGNNKVVWTLVILGVPIVGALAYAIYGPTSFIRRDRPITSIPTVPVSAVRPTSEAREAAPSPSEVPSPADIPHRSPTSEQVERRPRSAERAHPRWSERGPRRRSTIPNRGGTGAEPSPDIAPSHNAAPRSGSVPREGHGRRTKQP